MKTMQRQHENRFGLFATLLLFLLVLTVSIFGFAAAGQRTDSESLQAVESNLRRAVVECYALEGAYPESLDYIRDHYGVYAGEKYYVHYGYNGQNIMPDILVMPAQ